MINAEYISHYKANLKIATPIVLGQLGIMATALVDTAMVGRVSKEALAGASLANSSFYFMVLLVIGMVYGVTPLVGKALGENDHFRISALLKNSTLLFGVFGAVVSIAMYFSAPVLGYLGQPEETVVEAIPYFKILCLGVLPWSLFLVLQQFTEGLAVTVPAMVVNLISNLVNVVLNYLFIFGNHGFPEMGLEGAGWATFASRIVLVIAMVIWFLRSPRMKRYVSNFMSEAISKVMMFRIVRLGTPIALQQIFEMGAFTVGAIMVGWFGTTALAGHHIAILICATTYRMANGVGSTVTVRVSRYFGERDTRKMKMAGYSNFVIIIAFMLVASLIIVLAGEPVAGLFTDDSEVLEMSAALLLFAAAFQLFDGVQVVALGALRGLHEVNIPTVITGISYWVVMVPLCYFLAKTMGMGADGVWLGYVIGLFLSAVLLFLRYEWKSRRVFRDIDQEDQSLHATG